MDTLDKQLIEELTSQILNPKGGSCQWGARNYFLQTVNKLRKNCGLDAVKLYHIPGHTVEKSKDGASQ
jgi:hypothetical protein